MAGTAPHVLVVDDSADIRFLLVTLLRCEGFTVAEASSADDAIDAVETDPPSVIVLDQQLGSGQRGTDIAPRLKHLAPDCRIVMYTAASSLADVDVEAVDAVLDKGEDVTTLSRLVTVLANEAARAVPA
jgi:DNA-binding NtrC family response regulator